MAFVLKCDNAHCGKVLSESAEGQPNLHRKANTYCDHCAGYIEDVEARLKEFIDSRANVFHEEVAAEKERLMRQMTAPQRFDGEGDDRIPPAASSPSEFSSPSFPPRIVVVDQS